MYPLTCPDGKLHDFDDTPDKPFNCTVCGISYDDFRDTEKKLEELQKHVQVLVDYTNGGSPDFFALAMIEVMNQTHRTLQQNFFRSLSEFICQTKDKPFDLINAASIEWCKKVSEIDRGSPII